MLCPPYSDQWTTEIGAWRDTEGGAGQGSGSCCHCSTGKKIHICIMEKRVQILLGQEKRKLCGWVGALMGLFLLGFYLMFFFFGGGGYCENSHPSLSYLKKSIKIVISK